MRCLLLSLALGVAIAIAVVADSALAFASATFFVLALSTVVGVGAVDLCASFFPGLKDASGATSANCVMRAAGVATSRSCGDSGVWYGL